MSISNEKINIYVSGNDEFVISKPKRIAFMSGHLFDLFDTGDLREEEEGEFPTDKKRYGLFINEASNIVCPVVLEILFRLL
jgi:hypothetical protein